MPLLSVFGGKLTTYRKLSEHALDKLSGYLPTMGVAWTHKDPLPGGDLNGEYADWYARFCADYAWLPEAVARHYGRAYGVDAYRLLADAAQLSDLGRHFGSTLYETEARWCREQEWAVTVDDLITRRTKHGLFLSDTEKQALETWWQDSSTWA